MKSTPFSVPLKIKGSKIFNYNRIITVLQPDFGLPLIANRKRSAG